MPYCNWKMFVGSVLLMFLLTMAEPWLARYENLELLDYNTLLSWMATCSGFSVFIGLRARWLQCDAAVKIVNAISRATFIVYIFQEHDSVRTILWDRVQVLQYANVPVYRLALLTIYVFGALLLISLVIEAVYSFAQKLYLKRIEVFAEQRILNFMNRK